MKLGEHGGGDIGRQPSELHPDETHVLVVGDCLAGVLVERAHDRFYAVDLLDRGNLTLDRNRIARVIDRGTGGSGGHHLDRGASNRREHGTQLVESLLRFGAGDRKRFGGLPTEGNTAAEDSGEEHKPDADGGPRTTVGEPSEAVEKSCHERS